MNGLVFKKLVCGITLIALVIGFPTWAMAMTEEELHQEWVREQITDHNKKLELFERIKFKGDIRLRYEHKNRDENNGIANDADGAVDTQRFRYRFRFGANVHVHRDVDVGFRLRTANSATSGNETLGGENDPDEFDIDLAFIKWAPKIWNLKGFTAEGGRVKQQFTKSELVWDGDVTFEGFQEYYERNFGDTGIRLMFGQYLYDEKGRTNSSANDDIYVLAFQGQIKQKTPWGKGRFAVAYYDYENLRENVPDGTRGSGAGNAQRNSGTGADGARQWLTNMRILTMDGDWKWGMLGHKWKVFGGYAWNTDADAPPGNNTIAEDLDTAWEVGGEIKTPRYDRPGDWKLKAFYRSVQQDAVFSPMADSDFHDGGTNGKGVELQVKAAITKGMEFNYTFWSTQNERDSIAGEQHEMDHHQIDFKVKF